MSRSPLFRRLIRSLHLARELDRAGIPTSEGMAREAEKAKARGITRRGVLAGMGAAGTLLASGVPRRARANGPRRTTVDVGIVGAGLAGLACADALRRRGIVARVYEAGTRVGGRCYSLRDHFPGQVAERGGELIDNLHKTMIGYAREFGLTLEDLSKEPGEVFYYFDGVRVPEAVVVDEYRAFVAAMRDDLRTLSGAPSADDHNEADVALDRMSLAEYLDTRGAGPIIQKAIIEAYEAEYGLAASEQSSLNFLLFIHADRRSKFTPFGVFSDERYHVVEGNDAIAQGLAGKLPGQIQLDHRLVAVRKASDGRIELTFKKGATTVVVRHEVVVLATPFTVLRNVELHASLDLPPWKIRAIHDLGYGTNAKMMIGFDGPVWAEHGSNGAAYADLADFQASWETNPTAATSARAILTDYSSAGRGANLDPSKVQTEAGRFLAAADKVFPGALARATRLPGGAFRAHLEHWPSNPLVRGSYTCYKPGQFTTIAGNEGKPIGNLLFAGEHANSFYEWQGFMEGAALSGLDAAALIG